MGKIYTVTQFNTIDKLLTLLVRDAWLLKDFYDLIESLVNKIGHYKPDEFGKYMCEESIGGNYSGTNFKILITE